MEQGAGISLKVEKTRQWVLHGHGLSLKGPRGGLLELDKADGGSGVQASKAGFGLGAAPENCSHLLQAWGISKRRPEAECPVLLPCCVCSPCWAPPVGVSGLPHPPSGGIQLSLCCSASPNTDISKGIWVVLEAVDVLGATTREHPNLFP